MRAKSDGNDMLSRQEGLTMKPSWEIRIRVAALILAVIFPGLAASAQSASPTALRDQLMEQYKSGVVLVIQKDGIMGFPSDSVAVIPTKYEDGHMHPPNSLMSAMVKNTSHPLKTNTKVNPSKVDVNLKKEQVSLSIVECDSCNGVENSSYKATV